MVDRHITTLKDVAGLRHHIGVRVTLTKSRLQNTAEHDGQGELGRMHSTTWTQPDRFSASRCQTSRDALLYDLNMSSRAHIHSILMERDRLTLPPSTGHPTLTASMPIFSLSSSERGGRFDLSVGRW